MLWDLIANKSGFMKLKPPLEKFPYDEAIEECVLGCASMRSIMSVVLQVAKFDVNVLITGESGTGKELLSKIIHLQSLRADKPFVPINCGVLSGLMFEDKLFGHEKGAFTGAVSAKPGCFETADRGTLFLDEVSELPFGNQVDFLRVLEDFTFTRIGSNRMIRVDVRLISATNKDLRDLVKKGKFREDLFYRLQVVPLNLPPLRERKEAIPRLADHFLDRLRAKYKKNKPRITQEVMDVFCQYHWPGNIRELKNLLERVFIVNSREVIDLEMLPADFKWHVEEDSPMPDLAEIRRRAEKKAIIQVLRHTDGDKGRSAKILNISPRTLRYKIQTLQINGDRM